MWQLTIVLGRWHQRCLCPTLTVTRKCSGKGKASVVNPIIRWSVEWGWVTVHSLLCTNVSRCGPGPVVWPRSGAGGVVCWTLSARRERERESILWGGDSTLKLVFCKQWTLIHVKRQENNWQRWRIVLYCFSLFVVNSGQPGLLSHTTTIVRIYNVVKILEL